MRVISEEREGEASPATCGLSPAGSSPRRSGRCIRPLRQFCVPLHPAWGLRFGADGFAYDTARTTSTGTATSINRFSSSTGAFIDSFALGRDGWSIAIGPDGLIYDSSNSAGNFVERFGPQSLAAFTVTLDTPSATPVSVDYTTASGSATAGRDFTPASGTLTFAPGEPYKTIIVPSMDDSISEPTETFTLNLSNPVGATISDGTGVGTIFDNETKFYVADDGASNRTYTYAQSVTGIGSTELASGNTSPRGAASTAAGDKVWVVDANRQIYVYDNGGNMLGYWLAGSLQRSDTPEGIATNGTDVWLVDSHSDKVYKYAGAASRLSGSQNAASSFSLYPGKVTGGLIDLSTANNNPKDIVTDGASIWVVNDGNPDRVYKYTVGGSFLGYWAIDSANASPTGITLNPANVSDLWIVDSGTDKVYQYTGAASRTSGSQAAATTFALSSANTNPQGIADPPLVHAKPKPMPSHRSRLSALGSRLSDADVAAFLGLGKEHKAAIDNLFARRQG